MRVFDWLPLLQRQGIEYVESGPNVKRGEVNIRCPWCGSADPSKHLGISLSSGFYSCWRARDRHSGKSPVRLLMALLRVSYGEARDIAGLGDDYVDPEGFSAMAARLLRPSLAPAAATPEASELRMRDEFLAISSVGRTRRHYEYLLERKFDDRAIRLLGDRYGLRGAVSGDYASRVVVPYTAGGRLVTWTARAIAPSRIRYMDLSVVESIVPVKDVLFNADLAAEHGDVLVLVEGPFDALKIDAFGSAHGVRAVAMSTNSISEAQAYALAELAPAFSQVLAMMDNKTGYGSADSMRIKRNLAFLRGLRTCPVPFGKGDAGDLSRAEVEAWSLSSGVHLA